MLVTNIELVCQKLGDELDATAAAADLRAELIAGEQNISSGCYRTAKLEARRRIERELDLEEASIDPKREVGDDPPL